MHEQYRPVLSTHMYHWENSKIRLDTNIKCAFFATVLQAFSCLLCLLAYSEKTRTLTTVKVEISQVANAQLTSSQSMFGLRIETVWTYGVNITEFGGFQGRKYSSAPSVCGSEVRKFGLPFPWFIDRFTQYNNGTVNPPQPPLFFFRRLDFRTALQKMDLEGVPFACSLIFNLFCVFIIRRCFLMVRAANRNRRARCALCDFSRKGSATNICPECGTFFTPQS